MTPSVSVPESIPTPITLPPNDRGEAAARWLASYGLVPHIPSIRSSDFSLVAQDPFLYYLTRRLGLAPLLGWSEALTRGSWTHVAFELETGTPEGPDPSEYAKRLADRLSELRSLAAHAGIYGDELQQLLDAERFDADTAYGWYMAARQVAPNPPQHQAIPDQLQGTTWRNELTLRFPAKNTPRDWGLLSMSARRTTTLVAQLDKCLLVKNREGRPGVWIVDLKTCTEPAHIRLSTCRLEWQGRHYANVFSLVQDNDPTQLPEEFRDADLMGVMHIAIQKPSLRFGAEDRPFLETTKTLKSGPRKGQTVVERKASSDEPDIRNYINRCRDWYLGTGMYSHLKAETLTNPRVNYSYVSTRSLLAPDLQAEYLRRLRQVFANATADPAPETYIRDPAGLRSYGHLSRWAPFYVEPVESWPALVDALNLHVRMRDEDDPIFPFEEPPDAP